MSSTSLVAFYLDIPLLMHTFRDGKSNYLEGLMLIALYIVLALACEYFVPSADIELALNTAYPVWVS